MRKNQNNRRGNSTTAVRFGVFVFFISLILIPRHPVLAQAVSNATAVLGAASGLSTQNIAIFIANIIRAVLAVLGIILVVLIVYAGYLYMLSQGDPAKTTKAKKIIQSAVIGLAIILSSYAIATFILNAILRAAGFGGGITSTTSGHSSEPLSGSLGSGIIDSHYPARDAIGIPRNTNIMITFKQAMDPGSFLKEADGSNYDPSLNATQPDRSLYLNADNVLIYPNEETDTDTTTTTAGVPLATGDVVVSMTTDAKTFVFNPSPLLGSAINDVSYNVDLKNTILLADGVTEAFAGSESGGYEWSFQVSTTVDLTPPQVVSVVPTNSSEYDRNISVSITFNEAMDPVAATGIYGTLASGDSGTFSRIQTCSSSTCTSGTQTAGTYAISNQYKTVEFTPDDACGNDPCGDTIYCLPASSSMTVLAHAATVGTDAPQAKITAGAYNGLVDAAGNSLDGNANGIADKTSDADTSDDKDWSFSTNDAINDDPPEIYAITPGIRDEKVSTTDPLTITFTLNSSDPNAERTMEPNSLNSTNLRIISDTPDESGDLQDLWYYVDSSEATTSVSGTDETLTTATVSHATFWQTIQGVDADGTYYRYYPLISRNVKSAYQICMYPAADASVSGSTCGSGDSSNPWCCDGSKSGSACTTIGTPGAPQTLGL